MGENTLLSVEDLVVKYFLRTATCEAVNGVSFTIDKGERVGLVGETGAGKTTTALSILDLVPNPPGRIVSGKIILNGEDIRTKSVAEVRKIRGNDVAMIFQDPMTSLNPVMTVGDQIMEVVRLHNDVSKFEAMDKAKEMLELVGIPGERYLEYPHQFSGGMKQRVLIAMALACNPKLLIADEPTSALDVTIQAQVLDLINGLRERLGMSLLLITHDLGVVAETCDRVMIMYAGSIVESGTIRAVYKNIKHPYTKGLFGSIPRLDIESDRLEPIKGMMPDPSNLPEGCAFCERCPNAIEKCKTERPKLEDIGDGHFVACFNPLKEGA
ncbi:MAG: ABC transporter ATP-binding protein [Lachnospiraceae bacterium]|nr:ABC transporter ATP-binding protein [Lachnospiraceae bacterium]